MLQKDTLELIVGNGNVLDDEASIDDYSCDLSFAPKIRPSCIVKPGNAEEIQEIEKWANETVTPLVPVSSGGPHFRGDTVPSTGGAVIMDLSRMNQIIRVDRRNRVCMIEPGVTFGDLVPEMEKNDLRLNLPLLPRSAKSVIGSMLEREPVILPNIQWDAMDPLSCIEVVFGTGDLFRTGAAAGPGSLEDQWRGKQAQVNPMGPGQTDFARVVQGAQGTMGIVTWATVRCEAKPIIQKPFFAGAESFGALSSFIYRLLWMKIVDECLVLNKVNAATILSTSQEEYTSIINDLPEWMLFFSHSGGEYFPEQRVKYQEEHMLEAARHYGVTPQQIVAGIAATKLLKILAKPTQESCWKLDRTGACADIFFLTTMDQAQNYIDVMNDVAVSCGYPASTIGAYVQPMVQGTSCHCEFNLFYDPENPKEVKKIKQLYDRASEALNQAGAFFSRPYGSWAEMAYRKDGNTATALKKVKHIFDPKEILNPGKLCF